MLRILCAFFALFAFTLPVDAQNACTFDADTVTVSDYASYNSATVTDTEYIAEPSAWGGETFWEGYESATPFGTFYDLPLRYVAMFERGREVVGMIEVRMSDTAAYALMLRNTEADGITRHGCAALIIALDGDITPLAWFTRGLMNG